MKKRILYIFMVMLIGCVANTKVVAQTFGVEQNTDGSYTFDFGNGQTITTNTNGSYTSTGTGTCSGCVQTLPEVVVYGYKTSSTTNDYYYTSVAYNNQYYNLPTGGSPPPYSNGGSVPPQQVINTNPSPVPPPPPPPASPCKGNLLTVPSPDNITAPAFTGAVNDLTATLSYNVGESSMFLGINPANGTFMTTPIKPGEFNSANGDPTYPNFLPFASAHTHPHNGILDAFPMPSVGDIYSLAKYNALYPSYTAAYVISQSDGSTTALIVTDHQKLMNFVAAYPPGTYQDNADWAPGSPMDIEVNAVVTSLDPGGTFGSPANEVAWRNAQAYVLDKFETGLTMVKKNVDGTFSQIHYVKATDAQGNISYKQYNCN
jgi:hypothetical protein